MLRKLYGHRLLLFLGALLFALSGVLHPLFHMDLEGGRHSAVLGRPASAHDADHQHGNHEHHGFCPICAGLFSSAEVPTAPEVPAIQEIPVNYVAIAATLHLPEFISRQQVRAPPIFS